MDGMSLSRSIPSFNLLNWNTEKYTQCRIKHSKKVLPVVVSSQSKTHGLFNSFVIHVYPIQFNPVSNMKPLNR